MEPGGIKYARISHETPQNQSRSPAASKIGGNSDNKGEIAWLCNRNYGAENLSRPAAA